MSGPNTEKAILPFPSIDRLESVSYPWKRVVGERRDTLVREGEEERDEEDADQLTRRMEGVSFIETSGEDARDGGEIGVRASRGKRMLPLVSVHLVETLSHCSPMFVYREDSKPRRFLTEPSVPVYNNLFDNENHDYILAVNDVIESPIGERYDAFLVVFFCCCFFLFVCLYGSWCTFSLDSKLENRQSFMNQGDYVWSNEEWKNVIRFLSTG